MLKQTVHFGAGNIGRGFIGALFSQSGYHVTFVDIAEQVINKLNEEGRYQVKLATETMETETIENVSGLNNLHQEEEVIEAIGQVHLPDDGHRTEHPAKNRTTDCKGIAKRVAPQMNRYMSSHVKTKSVQQIF